MFVSDYNYTSFTTILSLCRKFLKNDLEYECKLQMKNFDSLYFLCVIYM